MAQCESKVFFPDDSTQPPQFSDCPKRAVTTRKMAATSKVVNLCNPTKRKCLRRSPKSNLQEFNLRHDFEPTPKGFPHYPETAARDRTEMLGLSSYDYQEIAFQTFVRQEGSNCAIHGDKLSFLMHRKS
jgi:hypothetical protein